MSKATSPSVIPQDLKAMARAFYVENAKMNTAKKASEAERQVLFAAMEEAGIESFDFQTTNEEGEKLRLQVEVKTPSTESIDVELLREIVDEEVFMRIVTASKKAVETHADKAAVVRCTVVGEGTRNVFVKPAK